MHEKVNIMGEKAMRRLIVRADYNKWDGTWKGNGKTAHMWDKGRITE